MTSEQTKRFKYWQMRTIIATMVGYALFYFVRKNFSLAMPGLEADLGISKTSLGIFLTLNGLIYGFSRFANGILADRMNARWYMAVGLALCALANFAFGFGEDVSYWITGEHSGDQFGNTISTPRHAPRRSSRAPCPQHRRAKRPGWRRWKPRRRDRPPCSCPAYP